MYFLQVSVIDIQNIVWLWKLNQHDQPRQLEEEENYDIFNGWFLPFPSLYHFATWWSGTYACQIVTHISLSVKRLNQSSSLYWIIVIKFNICNEDIFSTNPYSCTLWPKAFKLAILKFQMDGSLLVLKESGRKLAVKPPFGGSLTHHCPTPLIWLHILLVYYSGVCSTPNKLGGSLTHHHGTPLLWLDLNLVYSCSDKHIKNGHWPTITVLWRAINLSPRSECHCIANQAYD